jgi:hypothetical protein
LIPQFTSCLSIGSPGRQANLLEMEEIDFAGSDGDGGRQKIRIDD